MRRPLALSAALVLACVGLLSATPGGTAHALCANTFGGDVISPKNVSCKRARAVVRTWAGKYKRSGGDADQRARGFTCRGSDSSVEGLVIRCSRGSKRVRFYASVPS